MTIRVRPAKSDAELEAWRAVRIAVLPNERTATLEEMRQMETLDRLLMLAGLDGEIVGCGVGDKSHLGGRAFIAVRVLTEARRRGVGTALLRLLVAHASTLGVDALTGSVSASDEGAVAFGTRFGFEEAERQVEQVKVLGDEPEPDFPAGVDVATIAERPELLREAYPLAAEQGYADMAMPWAVTVTLDEWLREGATHPAGSFVALADHEIVGFSGLVSDADNPSRAEDGLTVVRRDWRRGGLATALKRAELAWAAKNGIQEVYTWTQRGNEGMRAVNERLGYEYRQVELTLQAPLERVERALAQA